MVYLAGHVKILHVSLSERRQISEMLKVDILFHLVVLEFNVVLAFLHSILLFLYWNISHRNWRLYLVKRGESLDDFCPLLLEMLQSSVEGGREKKRRYIPNLAHVLLPIYFRRLFRSRGFHIKNDFLYIHHTRISLQSFRCFKQASLVEADIGTLAWVKLSWAM